MNVRVRAKKVEDHVDVIVGLETIYNIVRGAVCEAYNVPPDAFIEDGNLMVEEEYHTSHSWYEKKVIRAATPTDVEAINALEVLGGWYLKKVKEQHGKDVS